MLYEVITAPTRDGHNPPARRPHDGKAACACGNLAGVPCAECQVSRVPSRIKKASSSMVKRRSGTLANSAPTRERELVAQRSDAAVHLPTASRIVLSQRQIVFLDLHGRNNFV